MGNGNEKLAKDWKTTATAIFKDHPDWKASQIRRQTVVYLGEEKTPGLSSIQKHLTPMRDRYRQIQESGMESPWHLGLMTKYSIPSEAVNYILMAQSWAEKYPDLFGQPHGPLTVRQALWIARLYATVGDISQIKRKDIPKVASALWHWSEAYATREVICELSGIPFDTLELDKAMREGAHPVTDGKTILTIFPDLDRRLEIDTADEELLQQRKVKNERTHNQERQE